MISVKMMEKLYYINVIVIVCTYFFEHSFNFLPDSNVRNNGQ